MRDRRVSWVLLVEQGLLFGLVTDRDLRNRVVALNLDISRPVSDIATLAPMTVSANSPAFEALLLMARHNIHHIPVMEGGDILGMITATDLTEQHSTSAVYLAGDIYKQSSLDGLKSISTRVRQLQQHLAAADASAYSTGHIITAITDAITIRLIHLAEAQLGPAPVDYVWVAAGSQARNEQTAKSDQDNCLILDDAFDEAAHGAYFKAFSTFVCDGLAECGYIHCPGEMMAMTDTWRQPRWVWAEYFRKWVDSPKPKSLMLTCVFFDLRAIHGQAALLDGLRQQVVQHTKGNSLFLAHMVSNALKHRPPLGMFGQITLIKGGDNPHTIDLKHTGIVPIVDLARVYALAAGVTVANTHDRLEVSAQAGEVTEQSARDLRGALAFLGKLRIAHQARQMAQGQAPDNFLALEELSNFERSHLKEAFSVVQTLQGVLGQRYAGGRF
jgi:CBS domain-containing protein